MNNNNKMEQLVSISLEKNGGGMIGKKRSRNEIAFSNEEAVHQNTNNNDMQTESKESVGK